MIGRHAAAFIALIGAIAVAAFLLAVDHGYHPTDDGFIFGYSWRLMEGEIPYRDFIYIRTPLTPLIHTLELRLPEGWALQAGRLAFFAEMAIAAAAPVLWSTRLGLRADPRGLVLVGATFALALHNFPPMPWPTVDGILFASLALVACLRALDKEKPRGVRFMVAASVLCALAILAKQSFAPLAALLVIATALLATPARHGPLMLAAILPGGAIALATVVILVAQGAMDGFAMQVLGFGLPPDDEGRTLNGDLWQIGISPYLRSAWALPMAFAGAAFLLGWSDRIAGRAGHAAGVAGSLGLFAAYAAIAVEMQLDVFDAGRHLFFVVAAAVGALLLRASDAQSRARGLMGVGILAIAWCGSLSAAYQTPLLGLGAAGAVIALAFPERAWPAERLAIALVGAIVLIGTANLALDRQYREVPRAQQTTDLGEVFPRFGRLFTSAANVARFAELRAIVGPLAASGQPFVVLPDYPLIHWLTGTRNPLSLDWAQPAEFGGNEQRLMRELRTRGPVVIVERDATLVVGQAAEPPLECGAPPLGASPLVREVIRSWTLARATAHFCIYRPPAT